MNFLGKKYGFHFSIQALHYTTLSGTRLRNHNRLLSNLQYQDAITEAESAGYDFPSATTDLLQQAIEAFSHLESRAEEEEEEEEEEDEDEEE